MGIFKDILSGNESLFVDEIALDFDYIPHAVPYREDIQSYIASCIKPLMEKRNGRNVFIHGRPGIGKTVIIKHLFNELKQETSDVEAIYINCWKTETAFKICHEICEQLNYKFVHNKRTDELLKIIANILNKKSVVFCFDEVDKLIDVQILYSLLEDLYRKSIVLICNDRNWLVELDDRIKSRLSVGDIEVKPYNFNETYGILKNRMEYAFVKNVFDQDAFDIIAEKTAELEDIRTGLFLLREAGNIAEAKASRKVYLEFAKDAILKVKGLKTKKVESLDDEAKVLLDFIKENSGKSLKELYDNYGKEMSYRTFHRRIKELKDAKMINTEEKIAGDKGGITTIVRYDKKLSDF